MSHVITEVDAWERKGRGKTYQFFATDIELSQALSDSLPLDLAPYSLVALEDEKVRGRYVQRPTPLDLAEFLERRSVGTWRFFLRSHAITPELPDLEGARVDRILALNGLVNIFHGALRRGRQSVSIIGVVDEIVHRTTRKSMRHEEYLRIFHSFREGIALYLRYTAIFNLGAEPREDAAILISEKAAALHRDGKMLLEAEPGSLLR